VGIGLVPWVQLLHGLQSQVWPQDPDYVRAMMKQFIPALQQNPVLTVIVMATLAGVCEEILYRGPLQTALARRLPVWIALGVGSFLFAAAHLDAHGLPLRMLIGLLLGWMVLRSGSVFPAMLLHGVYDAGQLALSAWAVHAWGPERTLDLALRPGASVPEVERWTPLALGLGAALLAGGWALWWTACRRRTGRENPEALL